MCKELMIIGLIFLILLTGCTSKNSAIQPYTENPSYWQYKSEPVLLLGASDNDNLFQSANMKDQLETLASAGGNYIRNTMSSRDEGDIWAFHKNEKGIYDLEQWNEVYWEKFDSLLMIAEKNDVIVQLEIWDRFDYSRNEWQNNPYNPAYNLNYSFGETGFAGEYPDHPYKDLQPFFHTIKGMGHYTPKLEPVKKYQEKYVTKLLSISLQYPNVLYCMNNETDTPPEWGKYWIKFIQDKASDAGKTVFTTDMFDGIFRPQSSDDLKMVMAEPDIYSFMDISQINSRNLNQAQWDSLMWIMTESKQYKTRPINCTKVYGGPKNRDIFGSVKDGVEKFCHDILGGCASARFHRPTSGNGLSKVSQNCIKAFRKVETLVKFWEIEPHMELLSNRENDEAYLVAKPGEKYVLYFPDDGNVTLDLTDAQGNYRLYWVEVATGEWTGSEEISAGKKVDIQTPGTQDWFAVIVPYIRNVGPEELNLIDYVDPFIGTQRAGHQIPGPLAPFGMIHPNLINVGPKVPSSTNYVYGKEMMVGIALTNLKGVGCPNFGSIVLMPSMEKADIHHYQSAYSSEVAKPGYNSFQMENIKVEMTASQRASILKFHYPRGKANLLVDLSRRMENDTAFAITKISDNEITGYKKDGAFCAANEDIHHTVYFVIKTDKPAQKARLKVDEFTLENVEYTKGEDIGALLTYEFDAPTTLEVRSAISYVSIDNARENLEQEIGGKRFSDVKVETEQAWEEFLSRVAVKGGTVKDKRKFYTALYHLMSHPNVLNDANGEYPVMGGYETAKVEPGKNRYTVFSLWDTYRTYHPFMTLVYPEIQAEMCQSMMGMYKENGWLPQWELISRETHVMLGDPAAIVLTDTYLKGLEYDDPEDIFQAMVHNAEEYYIQDQWDVGTKHIRRGIIPYNKHNGWIPYDYRHDNYRIWATVATTQEYNLADWNIAQFAKMLGKDTDYDKYLDRSKGYKNLYDPETMFFRQRWLNGEWVEPFDPFEQYNEMPWKYSGGPGYCEGMAWHYNFFVPHDIPGIIDLMGGEENYINRLQTLFDKNYYEPTNEPDIAFPFLFNYVKGEEWRTQKIVRHLIDKEFGTGPDGIPGNDDTGTMSAWLLFAMMGFYPDCPGNPEYQLCTPVFDEVTINLPEDKEFVITTKRENSKSNQIKKIMLNGQRYDRFQLNHKDIIEGGEMIMICE